MWLRELSFCVIEVNVSRDQDLTFLSIMTSNDSKAALRKVVNVNSLKRDAVEIKGFVFYLPPFLGELDWKYMDLTRYISRSSEL